MQPHHNKEGAHLLGQLSKWSEAFSGSAPQEARSNQTDPRWQMP